MVLRGVVRRDRSLAIPGTEEPRDPDCDADERYERAREHDEYLDARED